jgi:hypothetical protein
MNTVNLAGDRETEALRGDLRLCTYSTRPMPCPERGSTGRFRGGR